MKTKIFTTALLIAGLTYSASAFAEDAVEQIRQDNQAIHNDETQINNESAARDYELHKGNKSAAKKDQKVINAQQQDITNLRDDKAEAEQELHGHEEHDAKWHHDHDEHDENWHHEHDRD